MKKKTLYENYHYSRKLQKRVIDKKNFTYRYLVEVLDKYGRGNSVLDIGCGTGTLSFYLASKGKKVSGFDISKNAIKIATENAKHLRVDKNVFFGVSKFPEEEIRGSFDTALCFEVLEHLEDDQKAIAKIFGLLKTGGIALFSVPAKTSPLFKLGLAWAHDKSVGHLRRYEEKGLTSLVEDVGFKIVITRKKEGLLRNILFIFPFGDVFVRVANRLGFVSDIFTALDNLFLIFGESQIIVVAKK